jgi:hypothetical protein
MMNLDNTLWIASFLAEFAVVGLLIWRCVWRRFPIFSVYCLWALLCDVGAFVIYRYFLPVYFTAYLVGSVVDSALEFAVLVELAWSVVRPLKPSLRRVTFLIVGASILGVGTAIWPFATIPGFGNLPPRWHLLMHLQQTASIMRILIFLVLAGCSQLLSIGWRNRELQLATGLGFYSFVSLAVAMLHSHQAMGPEYARLNQVVVASYLCSLLYWVVSFAQKEAERREFTPQMQNLLLAMAGTAKSTRITLVNSAAAKSRKPGE